MKTHFPFLKLVFVLQLFFASDLLFTNVAASESSTDCTNQELNPRKGLPNFFAKAQKGDSVRVAYLGGSITAQEGWRVYSLKWMKEKFPNAKFKEINAAIGGTGSDFGVFRLNDHVLKFHPDLVFVEFAVNDGSAPSEKIIRSMEGIVRQIWQKNPFIDICFVYTLKEDFLEGEKSGVLPTSAQAMEKVADKYAIPTINFGFEVSNQVKEGKLIFTNKENKEVAGVTVFCPDGVHPYVETGHKIYNKVLTRSFEAMMETYKGKAMKHRLTEPMAPDYFSNTKMLDLTAGKLSDNWMIIKAKDDFGFSGFSRFLDSVGVASQTGETLTLIFKGKAIGIYDIKGPDAGRLVVEIDGVASDTITRFDKYCTYRRMSYMVIDQLEDKVHKVVFKVIADPFDKGNILTNKEDIIEHPEKYKDYNWYLGKILMDGELIR
jgi:lysophospholipase L1-like esterase